jgi:very-short-patch-repair endonuclease
MGVDRLSEVRIARRAASTWGVLSLDELLECGLSHDAITVRLRTGRLHRLYRGVYAVGHANPPLEGRLLGAVKACGSGAVLSHFSAAALWGFVRWDGRHPEVTVVGTTTRIHPGLHVHRTSALDRADVARHGPIDVTSPARTLVDLAASLDPLALRRAIGQAQSLQRSSLTQIAEVAGRLGRRRGVRQLARIVATGPAPTRSALEDALMQLMLRGGLARPDVNVALRLSGRRVVPDFRWPAQRLVVEADGAAWHDHRLAREADAERQAILEAHGERVLRVTWEQTIGRPAQTLARLRAAGAPSARRVSSSSA